MYGDFDLALVFREGATDGDSYTFSSPLFLLPFHHGGIDRDHLYRFVPANMRNKNAGETLL